MFHHHDGLWVLTVVKGTSGKHKRGYPASLQFSYIFILPQVKILLEIVTKFLSPHWARLQPSLVSEMFCNSPELWHASSWHGFQAQQVLGLGCTAVTFLGGVWKQRDLALQPRQHDSPRKPAWSQVECASCFSCVRRLSSLRWSGEILYLNCI